MRTRRLTLPFAHRRPTFSAVRNPSPLVDNYVNNFCGEACGNCHSSVGVSELRGRRSSGIGPRVPDIFHRLSDGDVGEVPAGRHSGA